MMDFNLLVSKEAEVVPPEAEETQVDLIGSEYELNLAMESLEEEDAIEVLNQTKEKVRDHLVQVSKDLEVAGEDTSLLNHLKPHLEAAGIATEDNTVAVEGINAYVAAYDEANKPVELDLESDEEPSTEIIGTLALIAMGVVAAAGILGVMIGYGLIKALFSLGGWLLNLTKDNDELMRTKKFNDNKNKYDLIEAKECIGLTKAYTDIAKGFLSGSDKFDTKMIESMSAKLRPFGYGFDGSNFKPKTVLVPKSMTMAEAGWGENELRACNQELKTLGTTLVKFKQIMEAAEKDAKATAAKIKEKAKSAEEKPTPEEQAKAKEAVAMAKAIPKLMLKDAKRIASANRYAIKLSMK